MNLFFGNAVAAVLAAASAILIARLLGPTDYGLFTLSLVAPGILQVLVNLGVNVAANRLTSYHLSRGEAELAGRIARNAILLLLLSGLALTALCIIIAAPFASLVLHRPEVAPWIRLGSAAVVGWGVLHGASSAAVGLGRTGTAALADAVQGGIKVISAPALILLGFGVTGAVTGHVLSLVIGGGFIGIVLFYRTNRSSGWIGNFRTDAKRLVHLGSPAFLASNLNNFSNYWIAIVLAIIVGNSVIGAFQAAVNLTVVVTLLTSTFSPVLISAFAATDGTGRDLALAFRMAAKYVSFVAMPAIFFLAVASAPLMQILYGASYLSGSHYLLLLAVSYTPVLLGYLVIFPFFNGVGRTMLTLYTVGLDALVLITLAPVLGIWMGMGANGLVLSMFLSNLASALVGLGFARKHYSATLDFKAAAKILLAGVLSFAVTYAVPQRFPPEVSVPLDLVAVSVLYLTLSPVFGVLDLRDIRVFRQALGRIPLVGSVARPIIWYEERLYAMLRSEEAKGTPRHLPPPE